VAPGLSVSGNAAQPVLSVTWANGPLKVAPDSVSAAEPLLVRVKRRVGVAPMVTAPKSKLCGLTPSAGAPAATATPLPPSASENCAPPSVTTISVALRAPVAVGRSAVVRVQLAPAPTWALATQVPPRTKSPGLAPPSVSVAMRSAAVPALLKVVVCTAAVAPTWVSANAIGPASDKTGTPTAWALPVPVTATCSGAAFDVTARVAAMAPAVVGAKRSGTEQRAPTASVLPQSLPAMVTLAAPVTPMLAMFRTTLPVLASTTVCAPAGVLTGCAPKAMADGVAVTAGAAALAVPDRPTPALPLAAFDASVSVPAKAPAAVGVAVTVTVQLAPAATGVAVAQVPPTVKMPALAPPTAMPLNVSAAWPLLVTVTADGADAAPVSWAPKLMVAADRPMVACGVLLPVPERATLLLPPVALWVMVSVAARLPAAVGRKLVCTVQLAPAAIAAPLAQVPPPML